MKKIAIYLILLLLPLTVTGQSYSSNISDKSEGFGSGEVFSPFRNEKDTTKQNNIIVPMEIHQWHIDEMLGEVTPVNADTLPHLFQNWQQTEGMNGEYNFLGNMGTPRESRIFFNRPTNTTFDFLQPYDYFFTRPSELFFTDTKSPYTNLSYHSSGDKVTGDDRFRAYFATNAGKHFGIGFLFDYLYGRGRYDNQSTAFINFSLFSYYKSDRYNYHLLASRYHMKQAENGGITNDLYITNPEETDGSNSNFGTNDIPVHLEEAWNRNEVYTAFFTHNYNFGFYKRLPKNLGADSLSVEINRLLEDERMKNEAPTAGDSAYIAQLSDSIAENIQKNDNAEAAEYERRFINVARITHTVDFQSDWREFRNYTPPTDYYADSYLRYDSIDKTTNFSIKNTVALSLTEGFSKWAFANVTAFASYKYSRYTMPDTLLNSNEFKKKYSEHTVTIGGIIHSNRNKALRYKILGETAISGDDIGAFNIEGHGESNFRLWKQNVRLNAKAFVKNNRPSFYYRHYHSEHYWWDNSNLDKEFRSRVEGSFSIDNWRTKLRVGVENIKNYTYLANKSIPSKNREGFLSRITVAQESENIQVLSATLNQGFKLGILHLDTELTYQKTSNKSVLPLPELNAHANIYLKFKIAKVLNTELGADAYYFTSYYAPDYSASLGQFTQQNPDDKVETGNYPVVNIYANFLLKQTRFYVKYYHINEGSGNMRYFLTPHYPISPKAIWFGLSWNFYN